MEAVNRENNQKTDVNKNYFLANQLDKNCWPVIRSDLLKLSKDAFLSGQIEKAVYYESKALSCGFVAKMVNKNSAKEIITGTAISATIQNPSKPQNPLLDFVTNQLSGLSIENAIAGNKTQSLTDGEEAGIKDLFAKCAELPSEWNVLQISKMSDGYMGYATKKDVCTENAPLKITLFRYAQSKELNDRPLSFALDVNGNGTKNVLATAFYVYQELYRKYVTENQGPNYQTFLQQLTQAQSKLVTDMKLWLGPWISMFSGKIKEKDGVAFEKSVYEDVETFYEQQNNFTREQYVLLCIVARRLDLLTSENVRQAANDISKTKTQYTSIMKYLARLKTKLFAKENKFKYYPCILILDEVLDTVPWEMVNPLQEFTRFSSIYLLFDLYAKYKDKIFDGYLKLEVKSGNVLINPDDDSKLNHMQKRNSAFYSYWLPHWKRYEMKRPTHSEMVELLTGADVYVYSGHGTSLQYTTHADVKQMSSKSVMLIFGCESIAMQLRGLVSEADGSPHTLYATNCPAMLGGMCVLTDIWIDVISIVLVSRWITSEKTEFWDPTSVGIDCSSTTDRIHKIMAKINGKQEPSLLEILAQIRNESNLSLRIRSGIIYRGLPVYNVLAEKR